MKRRPKAKTKRPVKRRPAAAPSHGWGDGLPADLRQELRRLADKQMWVAWTFGVLWLVIAACSLALFQLGLDWSLDLSRAVRALLLVADVAGFAALVWWFGIRPYRARLTPEQAALQAERHWPDLRTSIISAVQLSRHPDGSPALVGVLLQQVGARIKKMDFRDAIGTGHLRRPAVAGIVLVIFALASLWAAWPRSWTLIQRAALVDLPLPTRTIVIPVSGDFAIPPGASVEMSARAQGQIPKAGRVEIVYPGKPPLILPVSPKAASPDLFSFTLQNVQQPFSYRIYLNDGRTPEFAVKLVRGPVLDSLAFEQKYPPYTGLANTQHSAGNLNLLAGSKLLVTGHSDQPLQSARIQPEAGGKSILLIVGPDKKSLMAEIPVPPEGFKDFSVVLTNTEGIESQNNTIFHAEVTLDKAPEITFAPGQPDQQSLVVSARPRLRFEVRDDFQVKSVTLCCRTDSEPDKIYRLPASIGKPGGALSFDYPLSDPKASLPWKEGVNLTWWIEAEDNNDVTGPGVGRSPERVWNIVSLETKRREILEKLSKSAETMEDLSKSQQDLRKGVGDIIKSSGDR